MRTRDLILTVAAAVLTVASGRLLIGPVTADGPVNRNLVQLVSTTAAGEQPPGPVRLPNGVEIAAERVTAKALVFDVTVTNRTKEVVECSLDLMVSTGGPRFDVMTRLPVIFREIWTRPLALRLAPGESKVVRCSTESPVYTNEVATLTATVDGEARLVRDLGAGTAVRDLAKELRAKAGKAQG